MISVLCRTNKKQSANSKEVKDDAGSISSKQSGLSNTPTRHSTQLDQDPEKSKKGEGGPETAKAMGTVSVGAGWGRGLRWACAAKDNGSRAASRSRFMEPKVANAPQDGPGGA